MKAHNTPTLTQEMSNLNLETLIKCKHGIFIDNVGVCTPTWKGDHFHHNTAKETTIKTHETMKF